MRPEVSSAFGIRSARGGAVSGSIAVLLMTEGCFAPTGVEGGGEFATGTTTSATATMTAGATSGLGDTTTGTPTGTTSGTTPGIETTATTGPVSGTDTTATSAATTAATSEATTAEDLCGNGIVDPGEACDDGNTVDGDGCSAMCEQETGETFLYAFVTSVAYSADQIGGIEGARAICNELAENASSRLAGRTFVPWLSVGNAYAIDQLMKDTSALPYRNTADEKVVDKAAEFGKGGLQAPIDRDESGAAVKDPIYVWTGTDPSGHHTAGADCGGWLEAVKEYEGVYGDATSTSETWTYSGKTEACATALRIYCLEVPT
ncbi:MAG TPA: myxococcus cysteine-rich repeat containing protein [Nannocystis sp.]